MLNIIPLTRLSRFPSRKQNLVELDLEALGLETGQRHNHVVGGLDVQLGGLEELEVDGIRTEHGGDDVVEFAVGKAGVLG